MLPFRNGNELLMVVEIGLVLWSWDLTCPLRVLSKIYGAEEKLNLLGLAHLKVCGVISQLNQVWFTINLMHI